MIPGITAGQMRVAAPAGTLLLDTYPGAVIAFSSSRRLRTAYTGACLRVRRTSDGAQLDIGFAADQIDVAAINSFCSGTTGRVITWYDQSGNGMHVTQATVSAMPIIYQSGAVTLINSTPALLFSGVEGLVTSALTPWPASVGQLTVLAAYRVTSTSLGVIYEAGYPNQHSTNTARALLDTNDTFGGASSILFGGRGGSSATAYGLAPNLAPSYNRVFKGVWNPAGANTAATFPTFQINNAAVTPGSAGSPGTSNAVSQFDNVGFTIGCRGNAASLRFTGSIGEIIFYPGTAHAAASGLDTNVMTQYGL